MSTVSANGVDLYVEERGTGETIVFAHGLAVGLRFFEPQLAGLSEDYRTVAFDFRGHGRSETTEYGHTLGQYAGDLHAVLEALDCEDVILVGWSMGALISWEYVERFGTDRISALVDVDMEPSPYQRPDYPYGTYTLEGLREIVIRLQTDRHALIEEAVDRLCKHPPTGDVRRMMIDEMSRCSPTVQGTLQLSLIRDYRDILSEIELPSLICVGEDGEWRSAESVAYTAEFLTNARIERFPESGHCLTVEEPERFNRAIADFASSL